MLYVRNIHNSSCFPFKTILLAVHSYLHLKLLVLRTSVLLWTEIVDEYHTTNGLLWAN